MSKRRTKGKRVSLPRITLLAYGRRDLIEFTSAVESLRHLVHDLAAQVEQLKGELARRKRSKPAATSPSKESTDA